MMLVLTRGVSQSILIGHDVEIFVVEIRGDKVRLGVMAPANVPVHRREVYDEMAKDGGVKSLADEAGEQELA